MKLFITKPIVARTITDFFVSVFFLSFKIAFTPKAKPKTGKTTGTALTRLKKPNSNDIIAELI